MASVNLSVTPREGSGKGPARRLRMAGQVPAILYGFGTEPQSVSVNDVVLRKALSTPAGIRAILQLKVEGTNQPFAALVKELQRHPLSRKITHIDLLSIDINLPVDVSVPIHPVGIPIGVKTQGGNLEWQRRELELRVLPTKIPQFIEVDVSQLELNDTVHVGDITVPDAEMLEEANVTICSVKTTRMSVAVDTEGDEGEAEAEAAAPAGGADGGDSDS